MKLKNYTCEGRFETDSGRKVTIWSAVNPKGEHELFYMACGSRRFISESTKNDWTKLTEAVPLKGMRASIYRDADGGDYTNGRISAKVKNVVLIGCGMDEIFEPSEDCPALFLSEHMGDIVAHPQMVETHTFSFGGNFAYSSDSRFNEVCGGPIRIHDRKWTQFDYAHMD